MGFIKKIPDELIAKIAAGEVIERPCFVVKELIENSLDAGASKIIIEIEDSGLKKIRVTDDGFGMGEEDLLLCFKHHTTSKLEENLLKIKTLGFRGEALSSISSVAKLTIISRTQKDITGLKITVGDKKVLPIGCPQGTEVIVEDLFFSVPVRRKFLKSKQTEFRLIADVVLQSAIANPSVHFSLTHNKKSVFEFSIHQDLKERVAKQFGQEFDEFIPIKSEDSYFKLSGFLGKPHLSFSTSQKYLLFVNNRPVTDSLIMSAVKEAYGTLLEPTSYPLFVLFLTLPWELVDINIHPRKEQIQFVNKKSIFDFVKQAIAETLEKNNLTFGNISWQKDLSFSLTKSSLAKTIRKKVSADLVEKEKPVPIIQLHNLYLITEAENSILFIDQHAAHERILYEKFLEAFLNEKNKGESKLLLKPLILDLSHNDFLTLDEHKNQLEQLGFKFENFKQEAVRVLSIPEVLSDRDITSLILESLKDLQESKKIKLVDLKSNKMLSYLACRSAIKAGDSLTDEEQRKLLEQLAETKTGYTCPHGRPVKIEVKLEELHKLFKRI